MAVVIARYRYRVYPDAVQRQALARAFGCARVVFNDAIRLREQAHADGERISDTEVQRRVVTLAKATPEREWLGEVASVALVQACRDARRAYKNWFDSLAGRRRGRKAGHPQLKRKHGKQSIRLTRNGFALHGTRLYVAKVGDLKVKWSRGLPSAPSSVTVIREADGRYYASFVVDRDAQPFPPCDRETGIHRRPTWPRRRSASDSATRSPKHTDLAVPTGTCPSGQKVIRRSLGNHAPVRMTFP